MSSYRFPSGTSDYDKQKYIYDQDEFRQGPNRAPFSFQPPSPNTFSGGMDLTNGIGGPSYNRYKKGGEVIDWANQEYIPNSYGKPEGWIGTADMVKNPNYGTPSSRWGNSGSMFEGPMSEPYQVPPTQPAWATTQPMQRSAVATDGGAGQPPAGPSMANNWGGLRGREVAAQPFSGDNNYGAGSGAPTWEADPNANYGTPPQPGAKPVFDTDGSFKGIWENNGQLIYPNSYANQLATSEAAQHGADMGTQSGDWITSGGQQVAPSGMQHDNAKVMRPLTFAALAAIGGGAAAQGLGLLGAPGATGATGAVGAAEGGSTLAGLMEGGLAGSSGAGVVPGAGMTFGGSGVAGLAPTGAAGTLGGTFGGLTQVGTATGALGGSLGGLAGSGGAGMTGGSWWDTAKSVYDKVSDAKSIYDKVTGMTGGPQGQAPRNSAGGGLLDLFNGYYGSQQNKDYSNNMKEFFARADAKQAPFRAQLEQSYTNPDSFYNSNEYKGLASVYQNSIDRKAAQSGRLANPTDREVLLQQHALKEMDNYRKTLTGNISALDPSRYADAWTKGSEAEANANNPAWAAVGRGGSNPVQNVGNIVTGISDTIKSGKNIWDTISGWFD